MKLTWKTVITTEIITTTKVYQVSIMDGDYSPEFRAIDATRGKTPLSEKTTRELKYDVLDNN